MDSNMMLRSLIWAFGGAEQDDAGRSPSTRRQRQAVK